jgi:beta-galactosidase
MKKLLLSIFLTLPFLLSAQTGHDYLHDQYDALHDSKRQQEFRKIRPMPRGVVYIQHPNEGEKEMREHFRLMKKLGFNSLKQIMTVPSWEEEDIQLIALDEGIIPWWYGTGGWAPITDNLLKELKIPLDTDLKTIREHPKMLAYQTQVLKDRILLAKAYKKEHGAIPRDHQTAFDPQVGARGLDLTEEGQRLFVEWAMDRYQDIEQLNEAWSLYHHGLGTPFTSWEDFAQNWQQKASHRNYKDKMDIFRFKAEHGAKNIKERAQLYAEYDSSPPFRGGGEMSLFLPAAYMGVDMEAIADSIKDYGSFYPSTHLSWHFDLTKGEVVRPFYIQASIMHGFNKGGWTGGWESTGGPQQFDGFAQDFLNSYYVDGGTLLQLYMSQMAAGFKGFGIWCWNIRSAGKEGGEYSLLDRNSQPTERAVTLGTMGKAMEKYRDEIWQAHKEPTVGVFIDWNNDAAWAAISIRGRDRFVDVPIQARIGASRALMNANIPYEFVTADDLRNGLAARYPVIYLPSTIALSRDALEILDGYVQQGGRLVIDIPGGKFDENTAISPTGKNSLFHRIFGITLDNYQFAGTNKNISMAGQEWTGFVADMTLDGAEAKAFYSTGKPAITEHQYGKGTAVVLGLDMAYQCFQPSNIHAEQLLIRHTLGDQIKSPYSCEGALVYRLSAPEADHYFFINDGTAKSVVFRSEFDYKKTVDALTGAPVDPKAIRLDADNARWIRMER